MLSSKLPPYLCFYPNSEEYHFLKREIWAGHLYYTEMNPPAHRILDLGAHLGLSLLYFAKHHPEANIIALEPNPLLLPYLKKNVWENQLDTRVEIVEAALAKERGQAPLYHQAEASEWQLNANLSPTAWQGDRLETSSLVTTIWLSELLDQPTDLVKLDIEGSELIVLKQAKRQLHLVREFFIEYHPRAQNSLAELLALLSSRHFAVTIWKEGRTLSADLVKGLVLIHAIRQT